MPEDRIIKFDYYKATQDVTFDACCDSIESCVYKAGHNVKKSDYKVWHNGIIRCPKGTQKVVYTLTYFKHIDSQLFTVFS